MFQFPGFASLNLCIQSRDNRGLLCWVSPFGNLRIKGWLPPPRSLSQVPTSFIASSCQGIHRIRLFAWPYNPIDLNRFQSDGTRNNTLLCATNTQQLNSMIAGSFLSCYNEQTTFITETRRLKSQFSLATNVLHVSRFLLGFEFFIQHCRHIKFSLYHLSC